MDSCPCCTQHTLKNGQTLYRHTVVTPVIVAPGQSLVVPLPPEFVRTQDGIPKQDSELAAAKRWLATWVAHYAPRGITVLGDDLYCHQPFCEDVRAQNMDFLLVCKPGSHALLYEWLDDFTRTGAVQTLETSRWNGKQRLTERYRYVNQVPLRNSDDALMVNWCEATIPNAKQAVVYRNAWATSHTLDEHNVADMVAAGRARWKIENENNNVLKNHGYHFEHNFAHGKQHLSNFLATLNLLAFPTHTALEWLDEAYQSVRQETERSLILEVEYNFVATDAGRSQFFALPDMPYWSHTVVYALPGHNTANVVVDLNTEKMQMEGVRSITSSRLSTSIARYSETAYLGEIGTRHIPFHKRWSF